MEISLFNGRDFLLKAWAVLRKGKQDFSFSWKENTS